MDVNVYAKACDPGEIPKDISDFDMKEILLSSTELGMRIVLFFISRSYIIYDEIYNSGYERFWIPALQSNEKTTNLHEKCSYEWLDQSPASFSDKILRQDHCDIQKQCLFNYHGKELKMEDCNKRLPYLCKGI